MLRVSYRRLTSASRFRRQRFPPIDDPKSDGTDHSPSIEFGPTSAVSTRLKFRSVARLRNRTVSLERATIQIPVAIWRGGPRGLEARSLTRGRKVGDEGPSREPHVSAPAASREPRAASASREPRSHDPSAGAMTGAMPPMTGAIPPARSHDRSHKRRRSSRVARDDRVGRELRIARRHPFRRRSWPPRLSGRGDMGLVDFARSTRVSWPRPSGYARETRRKRNVRRLPSTPASMTKRTSTSTNRERRAG